MWETERARIEMRVGLLNQYYAPDEAATAQVLGDLGVAVARSGRDVIDICGDRSYADPGRRYARAETIDGVRVMRIGTTGFGRRSKLGRAVDYVSFYIGAFWRLLRGPRPSVVVALTTPPFIALASIIAGRLRGFPTIFWSMDVYPDVAFELGAVSPSSILGRLLHGVGKRLHRSADVVVALGDTMAERLRADGAHNVVVIHNWADPWLEQRLDAAHQQDPASASRELVVMYSGNMGMAHEFETAIEAARRLPDVRFLFVGGGPRRVEIEQMIGERGLSNVEMRGYVPREQLADSLTSADLHLVTLRDSMPGLLVPSKIYGILAAGRPTVYIGPGRGEIHDILAEGECGTSLRIGDVDGVVKAIERYREDREFRVLQGRAARALYEARFTRERSIGTFVRLIEDTARGSVARNDR